MFNEFLKHVCAAHGHLLVDYKWWSEVELVEWLFWKWNALKHTLTLTIFTYFRACCIVIVSIWKQLYKNPIELSFLKTLICFKLSIKVKMVYNLKQSEWFPFCVIFAGKKDNYHNAPKKDWSHCSSFFSVEFCFRIFLFFYRILFQNISFFFF